MLICLFVCLLISLFFILIILGHPQEVILKILWRSNLIWLRKLWSKMFICLFVCLLICLFFCLNNLGTPIGSYPENIINTPLDLAEKFRIIKKHYLFVCLLVCLLTCLYFILIFLGHLHEYTQKNLQGSDLIWLGYLGSKNVYLFVCL